MITASEGAPAEWDPHYASFYERVSGRMTSIHNSFFRDYAAGISGALPDPAPKGFKAAIGGYLESMINVIDCHRQWNAAVASNRAVDAQFQTPELQQAAPRYKFLSNLKALNDSIIPSMSFKRNLGCAAILSTITTIAFLVMRKYGLSLISGIVGVMGFAAYKGTWDGTWGNSYLKNQTEELLNRFIANKNEVDLWTVSNATAH